MAKHLTGGVIGVPIQQFVPLQKQLEASKVHFSLETIPAVTLQKPASLAKYDFILFTHEADTNTCLNFTDHPIIIQFSADNPVLHPDVLHAFTEKDLLLTLIGLANEKPQKNDPVQQIYDDLYKKIIEASMDAIMVVDLSGKVLFANLSAYNLLLLDTNSVVIGENLTTFVQKSDQKVLSEILQKANNPEFSGSFALNFNTLIKMKRSAQVDCFSVSNSERVTIGLVCLLRRSDVAPRLSKSSDSEEQANEHGLNQEHPMRITLPLGGMTREEHLSLIGSILECTSDMVAYTDANNRIKYMNKASLQRLGVSDLLDLGKFSPLDFFAARDQEIMLKEVLPKARVEGIAAGEYELMTRQGELIPVSFVVQNHQSHDGKNYFSLIGRDITIEKMREKQLFEAKQLYETLAEAAQEFVALMDKSGKLLYTNKATGSFLGFDPPDLVDRTYKDILEKFAPATFGEMNRIYQTKQTTYTEELISLHNQQYWIGTWLVPVKNELEEVTAIMSVSRNINKEKESEFNLIQALEKEREYNELQSRFVSMISHEFKTPLSTILSSVEILETYDQQLSYDKKLAHMKRIDKAVSLMNTYVEDILVLGRIKEKTPTMNQQWINPIEFCEELVEETMWNHKSSHQIKFMSSGECLRAYLDPDFIHQILDNVLNNAIFYSPAGSKITFDLLCNPDTLVFSVKDEGIGIPPEDLPQIFDPFFRANNHTAIPGTGLGLSIVKRAVDLLNGKIEIMSEIQKGTQIQITIPLTLGVSTNESDSNH